MAEDRSLTPVEVDSKVHKSLESSKAKSELREKSALEEAPTGNRIATSSGRTIQVRSKEVFEDDDPKTVPPHVVEAANTPSLPLEPFQSEGTDEMPEYGARGEINETPLTTKISGAFGKFFRKKTNAEKEREMRRSSSEELAAHVSELADLEKSKSSVNLPVSKEDPEDSPANPKLMAENVDNGGANAAPFSPEVTEESLDDRTEENFDEHQEIECPFSEFGCVEKGQVSDIKLHMKTSREAHMINICEGVKQLSNTIGEMEETCKVNFRQINDSIQRMKIIDSLFSGQFIWRVRDYHEAFTRARLGLQPVIYSRVFFSHRNGYKLAVALAPFGDGDAVGETNSVFLTILRGPHDGILPWPFVCPVTFTMINQKSKGEDISLLLTPKVNDNNIIFIGKPVSDRNPAFGLRSFVDLKVMETDGGFVVEDSCFIRVDVDLSSIPNQIVD